MSNQTIIDDERNETSGEYDDAGCGMFAAETRHQRTLKIGASALLVALVLSVGANVIQSAQPPKVVVVRIDDAGRAEAIKVNTADYIPQAPEIRTALFHWTIQRYRIVKSTSTREFGQGYYFLSQALVHQLQDADQAAVAGVVSGSDPEQDVAIKRIAIEPITVTKRGTASVGAGTAQIEIETREGLDEGSSSNKARWLLDVRYVVDPNAAATRGKREPNFQLYNPLGITITGFFATREMTGTEDKEAKR